MSLARRVSRAVSMAPFCWQSSHSHASSSFATCGHNASKAKAIGMLDPSANMVSGAPCCPDRSSECGTKRGSHRSRRGCHPHRTAHTSRSCHPRLSSHHLHAAEQCWRPGAVRIRRQRGTTRALLRIRTTRCGCGRGRPAEERCICSTPRLSSQWAWTVGAAGRTAVMRSARRPICGRPDGGGRKARAA